MEFSEGLKKVFLAGVGAVATTAEAAKDMVDQFVTKGELTVEQGKVLNEELKHNIKEKVNEHVTIKVVKEYNDVMDAVEHMSQEDRDKLREKLNAADSSNSADACPNAGKPSGAADSHNKAGADDAAACHNTAGTDDAADSHNKTCADNTSAQPDNTEK